MVRHGFGEDVCKIFFAGDESDNQGFGGDFVANEVKVNFDVFCTSMEGGIGGEVGGPNVVTP
jgi:hypothetical protein